MASAAPMSEKRVCMFYTQPQGCAKGDKCEFRHVIYKVCEYYMKPRGCQKGDSCNFLHPPVEQKVQARKNQLCSFYNTPRGCIKGANCDFVHSTTVGMPPAMTPMAGQLGGYDGFGNVGARSSVDTGTVGSAIPPKICQFFTTARGCNKGSQCDWLHIPLQSLGYLAGTITPAGPVSKMGKLLRPKVCEFYETERGCIKGESCEFIHQQSKPCEFFKTSRGCRKGKYCDFLHTIEVAPPSEAMPR